MKKLFRIQSNILQKATVELYDREVVDVLNAIPEKNMLLRNIDSWVDYEICEFVYTPGKVQKLKGNDYKKARAGYDKLRENEDPKQSKPKRKRLYMASLYIAVSMVFVFAVCLALVIFVEMPFALELFLLLLLVTSIIVGVLFGCRAYMIKKIGVLPVIADGKHLYEIKEIYETR